MAEATASGAATAASLEGPWCRREVGGLGISRCVDIACRVDGNAGTFAVGIATEVGRENQSAARRVQLGYKGIRRLEFAGNLARSALVLDGIDSREAYVESVARNNGAARGIQARSSDKA